MNVANVVKTNTGDIRSTAWTTLNYMDSNIDSLSKIEVGDFNSDGKADIFKRDDDGKWFVSYTDAKYPRWTYIGHSTSCNMSNIRFADFNGDGKVDIFADRN